MKNKTVIIIYKNFKIKKLQNFQGQKNKHNINNILISFYFRERAYFINHKIKL